LIEVTHQLDFLARPLADGCNGCQIIGEAFPTQTQFECGKAAFLDKCLGFLTEGL
jgi:hypothetical protein